MNFLALQKLCMARLGDTDGIAVSPLDPTVTSLAMLKVEIQAAYEDAVNVLDEYGCFYDYSQDDLTFAAGTREMDLTTELSTFPRKLLFVGVYPNNDTTLDPVPAIMPRGGDRRRARTYGGWPYTARRPMGVSSRYMYLRGAYVLGFVNQDQTERIVQVGYAPVCETLSSDSDIPTQVPPAHHEYIAQLAAFNLAGGEDSAPTDMVRRMAVLEDRLRSSATRFNKFSYTIPGV